MLGTYNDRLTREAAWLLWSASCEYAELKHSALAAAKSAALREGQVEAALREAFCAGFTARDA